MASTVMIGTTKKGLIDSRAFPVKAGEYIYQGCLACVGVDGYLYNLTSTKIAAASIVGIGIVKDAAWDYNNTAPSASGSISGDNDAASELSNNEKTVRQLWIEGCFRTSSASGLTQASVGSKLYATDNNTYTLTEELGVYVGRVTQYISATECYFEIEAGFDGVIETVQTLTAPTGTTAGEVLTLANPFGADALVSVEYLDLDAAAGAACTVDIGVGTTSSVDNLIDGGNVNTTGVFAGAELLGTNGKIKKYIPAASSILATASAAGASLDGKIKLRFEKI